MVPKISPCIIQCLPQFSPNIQKPKTQFPSRKALNPQLKKIINDRP